MNRKSLFVAPIVLSSLVVQGPAHADPAYCASIKKAFAALDSIKKPTSDQAKKLTATVSDLLSKNSPPAELKGSVSDFVNGLKAAAKAVGNKADAAAYAKTSAGAKYLKAAQTLLHWAGTKCASTK